ncbi:MAG: cyanophycinase [Bacteroidia bacterium]|nr:cyanophycinase [Bacteroidia bacterium]
MTEPKGKLILVGGAEHKGKHDEQDETHLKSRYFKELQIIKYWLRSAGGKKANVEIITSASSVPRQTGNRYKSIFEELGCQTVGIMHLRSPQEAEQPGILQRIEQADLILFSGGDQSKIIAAIGETKLHNLLQERYLESPVVIGGTSAGAMAASRFMITGGKSWEGHLKGAVAVSEGLALLPHVIIDTHFEKRGRFIRLAQTISKHPDCVGIGLSEDTGIEITKGEQFMVVGSGVVIMIETSESFQTDYSEITENTPFSANGFLVHIYTQGQTFHIPNRFR